MPLSHITMKKWSGFLTYNDMRAESKPNAPAYQMALDMVHKVLPDIMPEEITFFDDARVNLRAAKRVGFRNVWVSGGYEAEIDPLEPPFVDAIVKDIRDTDAVRAALFSQV